MKLSEVKIPGKLVRDGEFTRLDYCTVYENGPFLTFMEREKFLPKLLENEHVSCVLCTEELAGRIPERMGVLIVDDPKAAFEKTHNSLAETEKYALPSFDTVIGEGCDISPLAVIPRYNVEIGDRVKIGPFCVIGEHVHIADDCRISSHVVIGGESFSFARDGEDEITGLTDCGTVELEEGVVVRSFAHIVRGILPTDRTIIGKRSVLDAYTHIGHGAQLASRVFVAACSCIAGNARIGSDTWVGVSATVSNRIIVGSRCRVNLGSVVTKNVPDGTEVSGNFAIEHNKFLDIVKERA